MLTKNEQIEVASQAQPEKARRGRGLLSSIFRGFAQLVLMIAVVFSGIFGMNYLTNQKEEPPSRPPFQTVYTVDSVIAEKGSFQPELLVYGEVQASTSVELRSLVAGKVIAVNPALKIGGRINAGDELIRIDPFTFEMELGSATANLSETNARIEENRARIRIEESRIRSLRDQLELAEKDLERITALRSNGTATARQVEERELIVSQRLQALEQSELNLVAERSRLQQLEAVRERFDWTRMQAERNIEDTVLRAPFTGIVSEKNVGVGRLINANDAVVSLYEADRLEIRFTLTDEQFGRIQSDEAGVIGREVEAIWSVGGEEFRYAAVIDRIGAQITSNRGGVEVIGLINEDVKDSALRPGAFLEIVVPDKVFPEHFRVPETALYDNDTLYTIKDGTLFATKVKVMARDGDHVILASSMDDGSQVLTTRIAEISEGLRVRPPDSAGQQPASKDPDQIAGTVQ